MKLKNLIAPLQQNLRKILSLGRFNPLNDSGQKAIANQLANQGRRKLENLEIPLQQSTLIGERSNVLEKTNRYSFAPLPNLYPQYDKCDRNNPLGCDRSLATLTKAPSAKFCSRCGFPVQLAENKEIRGKRGIYQVQRFLGRQGNGRIYAARQQNNGQSVIIKEYLLPRRCFPEETTRQYKKDIFERAVNFQVAERISSDFRLIIPQEGISDKNQNRCYLIAPGNLAALPNLKAYLAQQGKMEQDRVITLLDQVLQSLEFLHSQKWQFTSGEINSGLVHGNLSLDSLLIKQTEVGFFVYLWDLSSWEDLFDPSLLEVSPNQEIDDLVALGNVGLYLLAEPEIALHSNYPLDPRNDLNWKGINPEIKGFLLRLLGLNSHFATATIARQELRQLTQNLSKSTSISDPALETADSPVKTFNWLLWGIGSVIFLGLLGVIWWRLKMNHNSSQPISSFSGESCIKDLRNVPSGNFNYGILASPQLETIFQINDTYQRINSCNLDFKSNSFREIINQIHQINLTQKTFSDLPLAASEADRQTLIDNIDPRKMNFALLNLLPEQYQARFIQNNKEYINETLAHDGLLVYVPFAGCQDNCAELGNYLAQKITLQQLRDIYTTRVSYWHQINPNIPDNIQIQAFAPQDTFALQLFKQLIFTEQEDILAFEAAITEGKIQQLTNYAMLKTMRNLWQQGVTEDGTKIGAIGFHFQDRVYKQCNVYPLAVVRDSADFFPMLIKRDRSGVDLFKDLSCVDNKQEYQLNEAVFRDRQYPLAFSLNLLYLNSNKNQNAELGEKITAMFKTKEFQCHLFYKKLIPLKLSQQDCQLRNEE